MKIKVVVHEAEEGGFWAEVPAIPGCATQGDTMDEVPRNVHEAIEGCLSVDVGEVKADAKKRRMRPIAHSCDEPVSHGIEVNIVDVAFEIALVPNCALPEAALPKHQFAVGVARGLDAGLQHGRRESTFDQTQASGKIRVSGRQRHDDMEVVGQNNNCVGYEGMRSSEESDWLGLAAALLPAPSAGDANHPKYRSMMRR